MGSGSSTRSKAGPVLSCMGFAEGTSAANGEGSALMAYYGLSMALNYYLLACLLTYYVLTLLYFTLRTYFT